MKSFQDFLKPLINQNQLTSFYTFKKINPENRDWRLNKDTASVGFIYRHIAEIQLLLGQFLGEPTEVVNTTMGFQDTGQGADLEASTALIHDGFRMLHQLAEKHPESWWMETEETPFFGTVTRLAMLGHIFNHNAHHSGQIALTIARSADKIAETGPSN